MKSLQSKNDIESYISDLLDRTPPDDAIQEMSAQQYADELHTEAIDEKAIPAAGTGCVLPDDNQYLSFSVAGSDFLVAASQVISVKSVLTSETYESYRLHHVEHCLNLSRSQLNEPSQFVLILKGVVDFAIAVDRIYGLVTVPAERLLVRRTAHDRPWYTAISRDFQSALLNSYPLGKALESVPDH
jgi:hypothetical protein